MKFYSDEKAMNNASKPSAGKLSLPRSAETLLPHRPPMLLAETLVEREGNRAVALAILPTTGHFVNLGQIIPEYFIELIAQTAALGNCYDAVGCGEAPHNGMLVGIDAFSWPGRPQPGTAVRIETDKTFAFGAVKIIHGEVYADQKLLAMGDIKVWQDLDKDAND
jgi:hypothetical protein